VGKDMQMPGNQRKRQVHTLCACQHTRTTAWRPTLTITVHIIRSEDELDLFLIISSVTESSQEFCKVHKIDTLKFPHLAAPTSGSSSGRSKTELMPPLPHITAHHGAALLGTTTATPLQLPTK
jgi:hypothetical protein